jgi:hypothetical protein
MAPNQLLPYLNLGKINAFFWQTEILKYKNRLTTSGPAGLITPFPLIQPTRLKPGQPIPSLKQRCKRNACA